MHPHTRGSAGFGYPVCLWSEVLPANKYPKRSRIRSIFSVITSTIYKKKKRELIPFTRNRHSTKNPPYKAKRKAHAYSAGVSTFTFLYGMKKLVDFGYRKILKRNAIYLTLILSFYILINYLAVKLRNVLYIVYFFLIYFF